MARIAPLKRHIEPKMEKIIRIVYRKSISDFIASELPQMRNSREGLTSHPFNLINQNKIEPSKARMTKKLAYH